MPLAAIPLLFAAQQLIEGFVWREAEAGQVVSSAWVTAYVAFAKVLWPAYAPLAILLVEPVAQRRRLLAICAAAGLAISTDLARGLATYTQWAVQAEGHLRYATMQPVPLWIAFAYVAVVAVALLASSRPAIRLFGLLALTGALIGALTAPLAFPSVWCFFAAGSSLVLAAHFHRRKSDHRLAAPRAQAATAT